MFAGRMAEAARRFPRRVPLEPRFAELLPEVLFAIGPQEFAALAARALAPKVPPTVSVEHIHAPFISIREQAVLIAGRLRRLGKASFRQLSAGATGNYEIVASFLALLELYREDVVGFEQLTPLGDLYVTWTGGDREVRLDPPGAREGDAILAHRNRKRRRRLPMTSDFTVGDEELQVPGAEQEPAEDGPGLPPAWRR